MNIPLLIIIHHQNDSRRMNVFLMSYMGSMSFCVWCYTLKNFKWKGTAIPFWLRKNVICFPSEIYLLCWNGILIFIKHCIFIWEWKTCHSKFGMELPFPNAIPALRVYVYTRESNLVKSHSKFNLAVIQTFKMFPCPIERVGNPSNLMPVAELKDSLSPS